jgi:oligopeptide transport system permease protein
MGRYIIRRLIMAVFTVFAISVITFVVAKATPGGPFGLDDPMLTARFTPAMRAHYKAMYGLDQPVALQYWRWLTAALQGDFGMSYQYQDQTVQSIILRTAPISAQLGLIATGIALSLGTVIGVIAALKKDTWFDAAATGFTVFAFTFPSFILGLFLLIIFCVNLKWFQLTGWGSVNRMVLPVFCLCLGPLASTIRFTRASVLDVANQDFVRTAYSKGLKPSLVMSRHVLKNALMPVITVAGPMIAGLISGSFFVEAVFNVPGLATAFVGASGSRDYPMIMGNAVLFGSVIVLMNLLVDITYAWVDPRIRYD